MKKYYFLAFLASVVAGFFLFNFIKTPTSITVSSPLPEDLMENKNKEVTTLDFWLPSLFGIFENDEAPVISAKSAIIYDLTKDEVIYEKNSALRLPMASLTKLMTAIVAIDHKREDNRYLVTPEALVGENTIGLSNGEIMTLDDLLLGVFMYSANDAAETLALNTMDRAEFIKAMNEKGVSIGLKNTNFTNPTGLEGDGDQYTTAYDLLVLSKFVVNNYPQILKAASTEEYHLPETKDHFEYSLYSQLNLLTSYPGVVGLKDGYTPEAGWCLITYYKRDGQELLGVILGSEDRRGEMKMLLDYSLNKLGIVPPPHS